MIFLSAGQIVARTPPRVARVILDSDLARIYGVETKALNRAVRRNLEKFPPDFMFQLTAAESNSLRHQIGALKTGRGQHRKYLPYPIQFSPSQTWPE